MCLVFISTFSVAIRRFRVLGVSGCRFRLLGFRVFREREGFGFRSFRVQGLSGLGV